MTPSEVTQITDYASRIRALLLSQYAKAPRMQGLVAAGSNRATELESEFFAIREGFRLSTAVGDQLDMLGRVYRVERAGMADTAFRAAIRMKAAMAISGTVDEILAYLQNFVPGAPSDLEYIPEYPAKFVIATEDSDFGVGVLQDIKAAGVQGLFANPLQLGDGSTSYLLLADGTPLLTVRN